MKKSLLWNFIHEFQRKEYKCRDKIRELEIKFGNNNKKKYLYKMNLSELKIVYEETKYLFEKISTARNEREILIIEALEKANAIPDEPDNNAMIELKHSVAIDLNGSGWHNPIGKLEWIIERAKHYQIKTGISYIKLIEIWESGRNYWYQNYYQDCTFPLILGDDVKIFESKEDFKASLEEKGFICPSCQKETDKYNSCECGWKSYGLFGTLGKGVHVFIKDIGKPIEIFKPVAWK